MYGMDVWKTGRPAIPKASAKRLAVTARSALGRPARATKYAESPPGDGAPPWGR
jgi:hypothetical protein